MKPRHLRKHETYDTIWIIYIYSWCINLHIERFSDDCRKTKTNEIRAVFKWLSKVTTWLRLLCLVIGWKDSRQFFQPIQWDAKPKPIAPCTRDLSRASSELHVIASNCDWFIALSAPVVTITLHWKRVLAHCVVLYVVDRTSTALGPVVRKPINANPILIAYEGVYFSTPKCGSTLIFGKNLH